MTRVADVGFVPMSAKPYHTGHDALIRLAASECDRVVVFVSTSDRKRKGELAISGGAMVEIWRRYIEPTLPDNVEVVYGGSPIQKTYEELGIADESGSEETYAVYGDPTDVRVSFPLGVRSAKSATVDKYAPNMVASGRFVQRPVERTSTVNVSGTKMREYIASGDRESFIKNMPPTIDGEAVWSLLAGRNVGENLLRGYVRLLTERISSR